MNRFDQFLERNHLQIESPVSRYVGPGWISILDDLVNALYEKGWSRQVTEIKQKFGELRFYTDDERSEIQDLIAEARKRSRVTCEGCGEPGTFKRLSPGGVKTVCDLCTSKIIEWEKQGLYWDDESLA